MKPLQALPTFILETTSNGGLSGFILAVIFVFILCGQNLIMRNCRRQIELGIWGPLTSQGRSPKLMKRYLEKNKKLASFQGSIE